VKKREGIQVASRIRALPQKVDFSPKGIIGRIVADRYDRPSLVSLIASELALEIILGIHGLGKELNSVAIARRFKTSRTPVREALMLLEKEGLVNLPPRRRPVVSSPNAKEIRENYDVRIGLLGMMAHAVARSATTSQLQSLRDRLKAMQHAAATGSTGDYFWANVAFHERAAEVAGNQTLKKLLDTLMLRALRFRRLGLTLPNRMQRSLSDHIRLMEAFDDHDAELAAAILKSNLLGALEALELHFGGSDVRGLDRW
jgi:DNA-binding GntR family transcriptional regulator